MLAVQRSQHYATSAEVEDVKAPLHKFLQSGSGPDISFATPPTTNNGTVSIEDTQSHDQASSLSHSFTANTGNHNPSLSYLDTYKPKDGNFAAKSLDSPGTTCSFSNKQDLLLWMRHLSSDIVWRYFQDFDDCLDWLFDTMDLSGQIISQGLISSPVQFDTNNNNAQQQLSNPTAEIDTTKVIGPHPDISFAQPANSMAEKSHDLAASDISFLHPPTATNNNIVTNEDWQSHVSAPSLSSSFTDDCQLDATLNSFTCNISQGLLFTCQQQSQPSTYTPDIYNDNQHTTSSLPNFLSHTPYDNNIYNHHPSFIPSSSSYKPRLSSHPSIPHKQATPTLSTIYEHPGSFSSPQYPEALSSDHHTAASGRDSSLPLPSFLTHKSIRPTLLYPPTTHQTFLSPIAPTLHTIFHTTLKQTQESLAPLLSQCHGTFCPEIDPDE